MLGIDPDHPRAFLGVENLASFGYQEYIELAAGMGKPVDDETMSRSRRRNLSGRSRWPWARSRGFVPFPLFALKALFRVSGHSEASDSVTGSQEVDTSKALKTGWRPPLSLEEGLRSALQVIGSSST
jgi:UDP-glucose 4-epimerase